MKKAKLFAGVCAGVLALSSAMAVSAADYVEYGYTPDFKIDFEKFIYEPGAFPLETAGTGKNHKYSDLEVISGAAEGSVEIVDAGSKHGNAVKINMADAIPGAAFAVQNATDLVHTYNSGKITVKYDMLIPEELDAEAGEQVFVQVYTGKTDLIGVFGKGGNISYPVNEWFTVTANYYLSADNKSGQKEILFTDKNGVTTVIAQKAAMPANQFFNGLVGGGISKLRFFSSANQNHSFLIDNISITALPGINAESGEYVLEAQSKGTGDFLAPITNKGTTYFASGIGGKDYTVTKFEATAGQDLTTGIQTREAFRTGVFTDDYVEFNSEYYFPTACNNVSVFTQVFSAIKASSNYGDGAQNRFIIPWEIRNGKIGLYNAYASYNISATPIDVPLNTWFTIKSKITKEDGKMFFAVDVINQADGKTTNIIPKAEVTWNGNEYLSTGLFALRESFSRVSGSDAVGPFYIGNKSLLKSSAYEIGEIAFTDDEGFEIDYIDGIAGINTFVNAVDYTGNGKNVMLWCAAYDENDVLIDVKIKAGQLPKGTPDIITLDDYFEIPENASYFKAGLVDDNMTPLAFGYLE